METYLLERILQALEDARTPLFGTTWDDAVDTLKLVFPEMVGDYLEEQARYKEEAYS